MIANSSGRKRQWAVYIQYPISRKGRRYRKPSQQMDSAHSPIPPCQYLNPRHTPAAPSAHSPIPPCQHLHTTRYTSGYYTMEREKQNPRFKLVADSRSMRSQQPCFVVVCKGEGVHTPSVACLISPCCLSVVYRLSLFLLPVFLLTSSSTRTSGRRENPIAKIHRCASPPERFCHVEEKQLALQPK